MGAVNAPTLVLDRCAVVTVDAAGTEYREGHVVVHGNRIGAVAAGPAPALDVPRIDGRGCLLTPGLVNTHHHLYQWITRGIAADATLFEWLRTLYPIWAGIDEDAVRVAATGALAALARTGCTTTADHHYLFPRTGGDLLGAEIAAAAAVGVRFHACRGSMDLGASDGGLPPDSVVERLDHILTAGAEAIDRWHDPGFDAMVRIALAPCSPFSVTPDLLRESAALARSAGVRLHTHVAETRDELDYCRTRFGCTPVQYLEQLGWTGPDVWFAHAVHLDDTAVATLARTRTGVAHCPTSNGRLGAGIARVPELVAAGVAVGLGVDGAASNEAAVMLEEPRHALLFARAAHGPRAMSVRRALELATMGGARVLGRAAEIGSIEPGKLADLALWRLDTAAHAGIEDPVTALILGAPPPLAALVVDGRVIVRDGRVRTVDEAAVGREVAAAQAALLRAAR
ncbi:8-oxoguanine deaminase [Nocardia farcinica]|uniref:Isoxanthopterin deaminase n=2 Tax=Nocardia farcinica TaxID=37329 RepID=A0A0H5P1S9_NOCFR|nr:8-oxoguanine deaminase [Nocardia farcinica]AXK87506.1 8-oxoguanine deaminase [Nocardia farcinica]MBF6252913.1 8-oxoguanine deaminase [Nocardia farcinica]MBF6420943.1 8-oxoguanine deaminase [Nocardia farcinica]MBF6432598.1 8-oxoguanine deaminase [Nocardia farcinica]MBF6442868.1 8-oxoguanine deaminase [Nocardia farcinica]